MIENIDSQDVAEKISISVFDKCGYPLKTLEKEWKSYCKSGKKPNDVPATPWSTYKNKGWKGLADFLGYDKK